LIGKVLNSAIRQYLKYRHSSIIQRDGYEDALQESIRKNLIDSASETLYGREHGFNSIDTFQDFQKQLPLVKYDDIVQYIDKMMLGQNNILWPGAIKYFSKSSGTTKDRSKFLPISDSFLRSNLITSSWDTTTFIYHNDPESTIFYHKSLIMGGSLHQYDQNPAIMVGDVSAIMINTIPPIGRPFYAPDFEVALLSNWDEKINKVIERCLDEDIVMFGGVPTWNMVLFNKILEVTGKDNMLEVWPELKYYLHGGVNFLPYKQMFKQYVPSEDFNFIEAYNASEGYFAVQDRFGEEGMRLLLNNGIFYEFIEPQYLNYTDAGNRTLTIDQVSKDVNYVMIISTNSGLWRYIVGDTVSFTTCAPYRLKVTGRIEQYINAFGEEVMVSNTDQALTETIREFNVNVNEYTVAPYLSDTSEVGYHQWVVEFDSEPSDLHLFATVLDNNLRKLNSDYDAKRYNDMAMSNLKIIQVPKGSFYTWLKHKDKLGGQNKIPRLQNDTLIMEQLLSLQHRANG
jgi:hypothetical protein